jgi:hypothetical protein
MGAALLLSPNDSLNSLPPSTCQLAMPLKRRQPAASILKAFLVQMRSEGKLPTASPGATVCPPSTMEWLPMRAPAPITVGTSVT